MITGYTHLWSSCKEAEGRTRHHFPLKEGMRNFLSEPHVPGTVFSVLCTSSPLTYGNSSEQAVVISMLSSGERGVGGGLGTCFRNTVDEWRVRRQTPMPVSYLLHFQDCLLLMWQISQPQHHWYLGLDNSFLLRLPIHCEMFISIPGLYPRAAGSMSHPCKMWQWKMSLDPAKCGQNQLWLRTTGVEGVHTTSRAPCSPFPLRMFS